jgi:uncharacterized protein YdhG (YjbR/CyaY superfamily)
MSGTEDVNAYLNKVPEPHLSMLRHIRDMVRELAPDASELITYGMPGFKQNGGLIGYAAFKKHCSIFPMGALANEILAEKLAPWRTSKGTMQFTKDNPIPDELLKELIKTRIAENAEKAALKGRKK